MTVPAKYIALNNRALLAIKGEDSKNFLQGIVTNDINKVSQKQAIYSCLLTPQGKFLFDFFITQISKDLIIECEATRKDELIKKLMMYKLRSKVSIEDVSTKFEVFSLLCDTKFITNHFSSSSPSRGDTNSFYNGIIFIDPRSEKLSARAILPITEGNDNINSLKKSGFIAGKQEDLEYLRISLTIPNGTSDMQPDKSFPLQNRMEELNAIDFNKGCYVGQEVTARSKHRGNLRKTLFTIKKNGEQNFPEAHSNLQNSEGKIVGTILSSCRDLALCQLDKDNLNNENNVFFDGREFCLL